MCPDFKNKLHENMQSIGSKPTLNCRISQGVLVVVIKLTLTWQRAFANFFRDSMTIHSPTSENKAYALTQKWRLS